MKRYFDKKIKITAMALALLIAVAIVPPFEVFANPQEAVQINRPGAIVPGPGMSGGEPHSAYNFALHWLWDVNWANPAPAPPNAANPGIHQPEGFDIEWRNASAGEGFLEAGGVRRAANLPPTARNWNFTGDLPSGSIISFRIVPWHWHHFLPPPPAPGAPPAPAPPSVLMRPAPADMEEILFMTDINVALDSGTMGGILVTWDNPMFNNNQVFSGYQIQFRIAGVDGWQEGVIVNADTPGVEILGGGSQWSFEFTHHQLRPGTPYEIRVIPLVGASPLSGPTSVTIEGVPRNLAFSGREFIGTGFYLRPGLSVRAEGQEFLALTWGMPDFATNTVTHVRIWSTVNQPDEDFVPSALNATLVHTIINLNGVRATNHTVPRPTELPTWFIVELYGYSGPSTNPTPFQMFTNPVEFDPVFNDFAAYAPTIREISHSGELGSLSLEITWRAFTRAWFRPLDDHLQVIEYDQGVPIRVIDNDLVYRVYITDELENFDSPMMYVELLEAVHLQIDPMESLDGVPGSIEWFYTSSFTHYINSAGERRPLQDNTIYYIRIVAFRPVATMEHRSQNAYGSYFLPPLRPLDLRPPMVPVRIREVDGVQMISDTTIDIEWSMDWFEVYDRSTSSWHNALGRNQAGQLVYGRTALNQDVRVRFWEAFPYGLGIHQVVDRLNRDANLALTPEEQQGLVVRRMTVDPNFYEIHVVEYDIMGSTPGGGDPYERYMDYFLSGDDDTVWQGIALGTESPENPNFRFHTVTTSNMEPGPIQANTSYVIFFRPVNMFGQTRYPAHYPTYTTGTTTAPRPPLDVDPTVPRLEVITEETTDTSITLRWNGTFEFTYELFFSELMSDYPATNDGPSGGEPIPFELIRQEGREAGGFVYFTVEGLFPYTVYHFWIRAISPAGRISVWSNPVSERTLDIIPPVPPTAIRIASRGSLQIFNTETSSEISTGVANQLILEFMRIFADLNNEQAGPRATGADVRDGVAEWLDAAGIPASYLVLFDELVPNRRYYVRVSTILTVTRGGGPREILRSYSYRMHLADNEEFLDEIEIILPSLAPPDSSPNVPGQMRRAESIWSEIFSFFTGMTDDEYDGDVNADMFPLPSRDWELIYDRATSTLTFRFRTNQIDATGMRDQNVDQRFISRLVQQRVFTYRLDLSGYNNRPVANSVVEMPYSILRAFHERQIALEVTMGNVRVTFAPGSLATAEALAMDGIGADTVARLMINSDASVPALTTGSSYASVPRQIRAQVATPTRTINFENFAQPLELAFTLDGQAMLMDYNVALYESTVWTGGWQRVAATHSPVSGEMIFNTSRSGNFAAIAQAAPESVMPMHPSRDAFMRVNASIAITDMPSFDPSEQVSGLAFNNMIAAVAMGRPTVAIYGPLSQADANSLARARIFVPSQLVTREAGIAALVTLYERRIGRTVQLSGDNGPADIANASPANRAALLKAVELGFIDGAARPTEALTMGDFMTMLDIIILDAG